MSLWVVLISAKPLTPRNYTDLVSRVSNAGIGVWIGTGISVFLIVLGIAIGRNEGLILADDGLYRINWLGTEKKLAPYADIDRVEAQIERGSIATHYRVVVGSRNVFIPETTKGVFRLVSELRRRIGQGQRDLDDASRSRRPLFSENSAQSMSYIKASLFLSVIVLVPGTNTFPQADEPGRIMHYLLIIGLGLWFLVVAIRSLFVEKVIIYSDRVERISPQGQLSARIWLDENCSLDFHNWTNTVRLESRDDRITMPNKLSALPVIKKMVEEQQQLRWRNQSLPLQNEIQKLRDQNIW